MQAPDASVADYPFKGVLRDHQARALRESALKAGHAWWIAAGGGKTGVTIAEASALYEMGMIDGLLVVAPNGPHMQWIDEQMPQWCAIPWAGTYNKAPKRDRDAVLKRRGRIFRVASINYEATITANGRQFMQDFLDAAPRLMLAVDEAQKIKNPKAKRTAAVTEFSRSCLYRRALSGTPILKGLEDLFSPYDVIQPGCTGFRNFFAYRTRYCQLAPIPGARSSMARRVVGYQNQDELMTRTRPYATRVMSEEFMRGATPDFMRLAIEMHAEQRAQYEMMRKHLVAEIDSGAITAQNALVQMGKLLQIASGFLLDEERKPTWFGRAKLDAMLDLMEGLSDEPVIIWTPFIALRQRVAQELAEADMRATVYETPDDISDWKRTGGALVANQSSGAGVGMNLQEAAANIYIANSFSSEARWQSLKRTDRMGQTRQVRVWDLVARKSVDEVVLQSLQAKEDLSRANIDQLRTLLV